MDNPEQEVADHAHCSDAGILGKGVWDLQVGWPDGGKHDGDADSPIGSLNTQPEHGKNGPGDDTEVREVVSETRSDDDGEGNMKFCADGTVENHRDGHAGGPNDHNGNGITPVEADGDDARRCLPRPQIDGVRRPICHPRPDGPGLILRRYRIHILVCPDLWRGHGRSLPGKLPCFDAGASLLERAPTRDVLHCMR